MLFALICTDKAESLAIRMATRPDHLAFLQALGPRVKAAGPFTDAAGSPTGSLVIIEADDLAAAQRVATDDPYAKAGLFQSVEIRPWKWLINNPEQA